jgi:hypothetical protein
MILLLWAACIIINMYLIFRFQNKLTILDVVIGIGAGPLLTLGLLLIGIMYRLEKIVVYKK